MKLLYKFLQTGENNYVKYHGAKNKHDEKQQAMSLALKN